MLDSQRLLPSRDQCLYQSCGLVFFLLEIAENAELVVISCFWAECCKFYRMEFWGLVRYEHKLDCIITTMSGLRLIGQKSLYSSFFFSFSVCVTVFVLKAGEATSDASMPDPNRMW